MTKVAVIGAGPAGITALKTARDYGHQVTCFEREDSLGGLWNIGQEKIKEAFESLEGRQYGISPSYSSLMMNTSSVMSAFSDFPMKEAKFLTHQEYLEYLKNYVTHFDLLKNIKFNSTVSKLEKRGNEWLVKYSSVGNGKQEYHEETFDFVMIANGSFRNPVMPDIKGLSSFSGQLVHSGQVRNVEMLFKDKVIFILGAGNSAFELSTSALASGAKKVYMSKIRGRRNQFVGNHFFPDPRQNGRRLPYDLYCVNWYGRDQGAAGVQEFLTKWTRPVDKSMPPDHIFNFPKDGTACTQTERIYEAEDKGVFERVGHVVQVSEDTIELENKQGLSGVDVIVCATGFRAQFPMLADIWSTEEQEQCELYHHLVSPDPRMDGLVFVGTANSISATVMPVMEMQARFACEKILTRDVRSDQPLYTDAERAEMKAEIAETLKLNKSVNWGFNFIVDVPAFTLKLATEIGCAPPDFRAMVKAANTRDLEFAVALYHGPIIAAQYRLTGPKPWDGAKQHIIEMAKLALGDYFEQLMKEYLK